MNLHDVSGWRTRAAALVLGCMVLLAASCGGDSDSSGGGSDEEQITSLVKTFFKETINGNPSRAYDLLDSRTKSGCDKEDFVEQMEFAAALIKGSGSKFEIDRVDEIKVTGDSATARVYAKVDGKVDSSLDADITRFTRESGKWRLAEGC